MGALIDRKAAAKALALSRKGLKGKAIGEELGVSTAEANNLAATGAAYASIDRAALTAPELALLRALADLERERLARGEVASVKSWAVSRRCRKSEGWCSSTANRRLFDSRWCEEKKRNICGLGMVHASRNGHIWMPPAGWALILAAEQSQMARSASL